MKKIIPYTIISVLFIITISLFVACDDARPHRTNYYIGSNIQTTVSSSSSSSVSSSSNSSLSSSSSSLSSASSSTDPDTFGIYSDTIEIDVEWGDYGSGECNMEMWLNASYVTVNDITTGCGDGSKAWEIVGENSIWFGVSVVVNPSNNLEDISSYNYLNFMYKGTEKFYVGMISNNTSGTNKKDVKIHSNDLTDNGLTLSSTTWSSVKVPLSDFSSVDMSQIQYYFYIVGNPTTNYSAGDKYYVDNIYFSKY